MMSKQQVTDAEHYAIPILRKYFSAAETAQFLGYSERTIIDHCSDSESPSEKKAKAEKRGPKTDEVAPYRDHILSLLQASRWEIQATSIHTDLVKKHGVQFKARTVQRFVNDLKIEFGLIKQPPETKPIRRGKHQSLTDDQHLLIHKLASHVVPNIIAECVGCGVSTVRKHIKDPKLPSAKKQEQSFKGRQPSAEKLARNLILLFLLYLTRWTSTAKDLHRFVDVNFPQLTCSSKTVEREVKEIMIQAKVPKSIYAMRKKNPGKMVQLDMTDVSDLGVTIKGQPFCHRFAIATLTFSGYIHCEVVKGGESFEALESALLNAIATFQGVPAFIQTDSLSAAYRNQHQDPEQDATEKFYELCQVLGSQQTRINPGCPHENGSTESMNRHFSADVKDALVCRKSADFASEADYQAFVAEVLEERNVKKKHC